MFTSTLTNSLPFEHAMDAFGLDCPESIRVKSEPWGVMVEVLSGENKGVYDFFAETNSFLAA